MIVAKNLKTSKISPRTALVATLFKAVYLLFVTVCVAVPVLISLSSMTLTCRRENRELTCIVISGIAPFYFEKAIVRGVYDARQKISRYKSGRKITEKKSVSILIKDGNEFEIPMSSYTDSAALADKLHAFVGGTEDQFEFVVSQTWVGYLAFIPVLIFFFLQRVVFRAFKIDKTP